MTAFRKYLLLSLIIALLNGILLLIFFVSRFTHTDTQDYIETINYLRSGPDSEAILHKSRILAPFSLLIATPLSSIFGSRNALIAENFIFYFFSVWLIFLLINHIYQNEKQAFYGTILYAGAYPMLAHGLAPMTDLPGWFFYLLSVLIALNFLKKPRLETAFLSGLVAGLGMLFKENVAAAPIFFASLVFIVTQLPIKEKLKYILVFGMAFLFPPFVNSIIIYKLYSFSYFHWYIAQFGHSREGFYAYSPFRVAIEIGRVFSIGWLFVFLGIVKEFTLKNIERIKLLLVFILPSLSFLIWPFPHNRMIFIAAPLLVLLGSFGLLRKYKNPKITASVESILLFLYILVNYISLEFFLRYGAFLLEKIPNL